MSIGDRNLLPALRTIEEILMRLFGDLIGSTLKMIPFTPKIILKGASKCQQTSSIVLKTIWLKDRFSKTGKTPQKNKEFTTVWELSFLVMLYRMLFSQVDGFVKKAKKTTRKSFLGLMEEVVEKFGPEYLGKWNKTDL